MQKDKLLYIAIGVILVIAILNKMMKSETQVVNSVQPVNVAAPSAAIEKGTQKTIDSNKSLGKATVPQVCPACPTVLPKPCEPVKVASAIELFEQKSRIALPLSLKGLNYSPLAEATDDKVNVIKGRNDRDNTTVVLVTSSQQPSSTEIIDYLVKFGKDDLGFNFSRADFKTPVTVFPLQDSGFSDIQRWNIVKAGSAINIIYSKRSDRSGVYVGIVSGSSEDKSKNLENYLNYFREIKAK